MSIDHLDLSYDAVVPSAIFFNENLEPTCVKFYAIVRNLTKLHGYCFATNEYLANLMKADISSIKRWLSSLKKEGYLEIENNKNGIYWQRHIYLSDKFKKSLRRLKNELPPAQNSAPPSSKMSHIIEDNNNIDNKKERESTPTLYQKDGKVKIELSAYNKLIDEFGASKIKEMITRLNEYADINPKRFNAYANHATVIRKWIREDVQKASNSPQDRPSQEEIGKDRETAHKALLVASKEELQVIDDKGYETQLRITRTGEVVTISYGKPHTKDMINNVLRKLGRMPLSDQ